MPKNAKISSLILLGCVFVFSIIFFNSRDDASRFQSTDDAYIRVDATMIAPQVSGRISAVLVDENQPVKAGDVLVTIDDREFILQVANAEAAFASARAAHDSLVKQFELQSGIIAQAKATMDATEATLELNRQEHTRYRNLASDGSGSKQALQQAAAAFKVAQANLDRDTAKYESEVLRQDVIRADMLKAAASVEQVSAALDIAKLNLSYCRILSPIDGVVSQKRARLGAYARTGDGLLAVVPLQHIYIDAYFRETQLANIRTGQKVRIAVDTFPGRKFSGTVESLGAASNASFSPIAPHSTSSNFTKVVQRLPVRISINDEAKPMLRVGMSVTPTVDTKK